VILLLVRKRAGLGAIAAIVSIMAYTDPGKHVFTINKGLFHIK
jgi:hypothetical protein